jgi:hypothetical protein
MNSVNEIQKELHQIARRQNIAYDLILLNYMQERQQTRE